MLTLSVEKKQQIRHYIYTHGRLLERKMFSFFFENGNKSEVINALVAYQNNDGGFGNGIEPDLLCPDSSAIGAETALYLIDILELSKSQIVQDITNWIINNQNEQGYIKHPPEHLKAYPHQPWWENPDDFRILALAGFLKKLGVKNSLFYNRVEKYYNELILPKKFQIYDYPYFFYVKYVKNNGTDKKLFSRMIGMVSEVINEKQDHYPLFSRYWYHAIDHFDEGLLEKEADFFIDSIQETGTVKNPFPNLPWWNPIFTLDGLIILKKYELLRW